MNAVVIIIGLFALYEYLKAHPSMLSGMGSGVINPTTTTAVPPITTPIVQQGHPVAAPVFTFEPSSGGGPGTGQMLLGSAIAPAAAIGGTIAASVGSSVATAIPIVGAVAGAIFASLMAASARRAAQARNENSAVANEVPAWDSGVEQIVNAYNNGQITASEAYSLLASPNTMRVGLTATSQGPLWRSYWNVVGPQVQPGRNGCQSGTIAHDPTKSLCSGSYGAGCCVAYDDLDNGHQFIAQAIQQAEQRPGQSVTSQMLPTVYASKYGGINRPGYTVTVRKPVTIGL